MPTRPAGARPTQTFWWLDDVPGMNVAPWEWRQTRGADPYAVEIVCGDRRFDGLSNPVTLTVHTPDGDGAVSEQQWKNLWILERESTRKGVWFYTLADVRWALLYGRLNAEYNVWGYGGRWRESSLNNRAIPYTIETAMRDAVRRFSDSAGLLGVSLVTDTTLDEIRVKPLRMNLGNSRGGGWAGGKWVEVMNALMEGSPATIVPRRDGNLALVDGTSALVRDEVEKHILLDGKLGEKEVHWQLPKKCIVQFQKRHGSHFVNLTQPISSHLEALGIRSYSLVGDFRMNIENVLPVYNEDSRGQPEYLSMRQNAWGGEFFTRNPSTLPRNVHILLGVKMVDREIRHRYLQPHMFNRTDLPAAGRPVAAAIEQIIRAYWRRLYRIVDDENRERYADIRLGELQADGTTGEPIVVANWVQHHRTTIGGDWGGDVSKNLGPGQSPFNARWEDKQAGLIYLVLERTPPSLATVYPGALEKQIRIMDPARAIQDDAETLFECLGEFSADYYLAVPWNALYIGPNNRLKEVSVPLFQDGDRPHVYVRAENMTANYSMTPGGLIDPITGRHRLINKFLNEDLVEKQAKLIGDQVKKSFELDRAGLLEFGGVRVLADLGDEAEVKGDLHEIAVHFGGGDNLWEIRTTMEFRPDQRATAEPTQLIAQHPREIL